jgi:hypothetical protein
MVWEAESPRLICQHSWILVRDLFLICSHLSFYCVCTLWDEEERDRRRKGEERRERERERESPLLNIISIICG